MRNKTQERIEELARERAATAIDLALVEEGIEIGKQMMAEMIATYSVTGREPRRRDGAAGLGRQRRDGQPATADLNEVRARDRGYAQRARPRASRARASAIDRERRTASAARTTSGCSSTR